MTLLKIDPNLFGKMCHMTQKGRDLNVKEVIEYELG